MEVNITAQTLDTIGDVPLLGMFEYQNTVYLKTEDGMLRLSGQRTLGTVWKNARAAFPIDKFLGKLEVSDS